MDSQSKTCRERKRIGQQFGLDPCGNCGVRPCPDGRPNHDPATACGTDYNDCSAAQTIGCEACMADATAGSELAHGDWNRTADEALEDERETREVR